MNMRYAMPYDTWNSMEPIEPAEYNISYFLDAKLVSLSIKCEMEFEKCVYIRLTEMHNITSINYLIHHSFD